MAFATVPAGHFVWTRGQSALRELASSSFGRRTFCGRCGTPLLFQVTHQPETVDFPIATLDRPEALEPGFHIFWASRVGWFEPSDSLPRHDRFRPCTRGLEGTEPPDESSLVGGA